MKVSTFGLSHLLGDVTVETFRREYWARRPLHVARNQGPFFHNLFSSEAVEQLISAEVVPAAHLLIADSDVGFRATSSVQRDDGSLDPVKVFGAYAGGATVILNHLRSKWAPILELSRELERQVGHPINVNCYLTPRASQGLRVHSDPHDVLILQAEGGKFWKIYDRTIADPLPEQLNAAAPPPTLIMEVELKPGDVLYLPSGYPHECLTNVRSSSLHLTVGIMRLRWLDLAMEMLKQYALTTPALRAPLPFGTFGGSELPADLAGPMRDMLGGFAEGARLQPAMAALSGMFLGRFRRLPNESEPPTSQFQQVDRVHQLRLGTRVANLFPLHCRLVEATGGTCTLVFPGASYTVPAGLVETARFVASRAEFTIRELPENAPEDDRFSLVRALIVRGLLQTDA